MYELLPVKKQFFNNIDYRRQSGVSINYYVIVQQNTYLCVFIWKDKFVKQIFSIHLVICTYMFSTFNSKGAKICSKILNEVFQNKIKLKMLF